MIRAAFVVFAGALGASAQRCLSHEGQYYYGTPTKGDAQYGPSCQAWAGSTCCTSNYTDTLNQGGVQALYPGFSWNHCDNVNAEGRNMSSKCMQYFEWQECFYSCDPWAAYYEDPEAPGFLKKLPVCASMCYDWYEACKEEYTCVKDWLNFPYNYTSDQYYCEQPCQKFKDVYSGPEDMCNSMWNTSLFYSTNMDQCYSFYFWGSHNPNKYAAVGGGAGNGAQAGSTAAVGAVLAGVAGVVATLVGGRA